MNTPPDHDAHRAALIRAAQAQIGERFAGQIDASSIVQDVYLDVCRHEGGAEAVGLPELRLRVRHKVTDAVRARSAAKRGFGRVVPVSQLGSADGASIDTPTVALTPYQVAAGREQAAWLSDQLGLLNPDEQAVLRAYYFDGLSIRAAAEHLRIPVGTAASRLNAGLKKLSGRRPAEGGQ